MKFLPTLNKWAINLKVSKLSLDPTQQKDSNSLEFRLGEKKECGLVDKSKGKKNSNDAESDLLERNCKIPMLYCE